LAITPAALLAVSFMIVLVAICIQLSISISGLQEQVRSLSEEVAQLGLASDAGVEEK
jgi:cell division protein FtsX